MRRTLLLALLALAAAGCPDSLAQRCPPESLPSGSFQLTLTLKHTPDECLIVRSLDGGQPPVDPTGTFSFASPPLIQASTLCGCLSDVNETISGVFLGGGTGGFALGPDGGGLDPQPTGIDGSVLQTLTNPDGGPCVCNLPCAEHYTLAGTPSR